MKKLLAIAMLAALPALAQSPDGTWLRNVGKKGQQQKLVLASSGDKITGTFDPGGGRLASAAIVDGQMKGSEISFKVVREMPDKSKVTQLWTGTVTPFELHLAVTSAELDNQVRPIEYVFWKYVKK